MGFHRSPRWCWHFPSSAGNRFPDAPRNNSCPSHGDTAVVVFTPCMTQTAPSFVTAAAAQLKRPLHGQDGSYQERSSRNQQRQLHHQVQAFSTPALTNILKSTSITIRALLPSALGTFPFLLLDAAQEWLALRPPVQMHSPAASLDHSCSAIQLRDSSMQLPTPRASLWEPCHGF